MKIDNFAKNFKIFLIFFTRESGTNRVPEMFENPDLDAEQIVPDPQHCVYDLRSICSVRYSTGTVYTATQTFHIRYHRLLINLGQFRPAPSAN